MNCRGKSPHKEKYVTLMLNLMKHLRLSRCPSMQMILKLYKIEYKIYVTLANAKTEDIDGRITELEGFIDAEQLKVDATREEKFTYEKTYRALEAEVGPIKYIAEFHLW